MPDNVTNTTIDPETEEFVAHHDRVAEAVWAYGSPLLLLVGTVGNILSFLVMYRPRLRSTTFSIYLRTVAVCDTTYLWLGLAQKWGRTIWDFDYATISDVACKSRDFFYICFGDLAIWVILALTLDRTVSVMRSSTHPNFRIPQIYAYVTVTMLTVLATGKNLHMFWSRGLLSIRNQTIASQRSGCNELEEYSYFEDGVRPWIALFSVNLIPVAWLTICNCVIIWKLLDLRKQQSSLSSTSAMSKKMRQTIIMCLAVSFSFLILVTPTMVLLVGKKHFKRNSVSKARYYTAKAFANFLMFSNHAINFYLYCISGKAFRDELKALCCKTYDGYSSTTTATNRGSSLPSKKRPSSPR